MDLSDAHEIIQCLPKGRTRFHYFKDRYALFLLGATVGSGRKVGELKKSRFGKLLNRPAVKQLTAKAAGGVLTRDACEGAWPPVSEPYLLTLGTWGCRKAWRDQQLSRPGGNLVLQLNFSAKQNRPYSAALKTDDYGWFGARFHPVAREGFLTMAWARLDVDLARGEVLIEEIQNDWLREAQDLRRELESIETEARREAFVRLRFGESFELKEIVSYLEGLLTVQSPIWDEAMLTATLEFVHRELGIQRIFYHSYETGMALKGMNRKWGPPRSLYTTLPRRFCFELGLDRPRFLDEVRNRRSQAILQDSNARFFALSLGDSLRGGPHSSASPT